MAVAIPSLYLEPKYASMNRIRLNLSFILFFLFAVGTAFSQQLTEKIPFDSKVKTGKLENGLTYFIRPNQKPEKE